jgi:low affinity Fe/Cu permease
MSRDPLPDDVDPVVREATEYAVEATKPPRHYGWIDVTAYVLLCVVLVISSIAAIISIANSIHIENEQRCFRDGQAAQARVNAALRQVADSDRQANDKLFKAVLGVNHLTRAQVEAAYRHYLDQRAQNDKQRDRLQFELNGVCQ